MGSRKARGDRLAAFLAVVSFLLVGVQAACTDQAMQPEEEAAVAQLLDLQPEMIPTLTAWPTPPPIVTNPPTPTALPRILWSAPPSTPPAPIPLPAPTQTPPATSAAMPASTPPPVGSNPPPIRLLIPELGLDVPVVEVAWEVVVEDSAWKSVWQTAEGAAGHHRNSANPGEAGNVVISGHHNNKGQVFRQVSQVGQQGVTFGEGDEIVLIAQDGLQYRYVVVGWDRFVEDGIPVDERRSHARYLDPTTDATLTLVTCWPYESNSHRVVVIAKLQPPQ